MLSYSFKHLSWSYIWTCIYILCIVTNWWGKAMSTISVPQCLCFFLLCYFFRVSASHPSGGPRCKNTRARKTICILGHDGNFVQGWSSFRILNRGWVTQNTIAYRLGSTLIYVWLWIEIKPLLHSSLFERRQLRASSPTPSFFGIISTFFSSRYLAS